MTARSLLYAVLAAVYLGALLVVGAVVLYDEARPPTSTAPSTSPTR